MIQNWMFIFFITVVRSTFYCGGRNDSSSNKNKCEGIQFPRFLETKIQNNKK